MDQIRTKFRLPGSDFPFDYHGMVAVPIDGELIKNFVLRQRSRGLLTDLIGSIDSDGSVGEMKQFWITGTDCGDFAKEPVEPIFVVVPEVRAVQV
jgi:hypothetical protein